MNRSLFVKPLSFSLNPKSRVIVQDFITSVLNQAEVDTSWSKNPRRVYERLHKYLTVNEHFNVSVRLDGEKVYLVKDDMVDV